MGDDRSCDMKWIGTCLRLKEILSQFDGMVSELKDVRYVSQLKRNLISVGVLAALGLEVSIRYGIHKMIKG